MLRSPINKALIPPRPATAVSNGATYLAFVDGLRAVSILAVVAYHIGVPGISGGFVGVDVFFVISGFLIINQIRDGLSSGRFSILTFYANRGLRILPPFLIVVFVTDIVAWLILPTTAITWDYVASASLVPLMISNGVFFLTQGYFDISSIEKPLLHTWTLSVEEQFYWLAPILLIGIFWLAGRRFGRLAVVIGLLMGAASLAGSIAQHVGESAQFYLPQYRAWEFLAGGFIGRTAANAAGRLPRLLLDFMGWAGIGCILVAVLAFDANTLYPSWRALLPVAGAVLVILCGLADPRTTMARFLALKWPVSIGVVSYGWYLWHWPILSFIRITQLNDSSLLLDSLGAGLLALALAAISYRFVEQPIRHWRKSPGNMKHPGRIVVGATAACLVLAGFGAASSYADYLSTKAFLATRYGVEGRGSLDNGCERLTSAGFPDSCFEGPVGMLLGDSHASMLFGSFAKSFDAFGIRLVSIAGSGCYPLLFRPQPLKENRRHACGERLAPFERLLARPDPVNFVIISANWGPSDDLAQAVSDLISEFDTGRIRILLMGPIPIYLKSSLECVVISDRFGNDRDRCVRSRHDVDAAFSGVADALKAAAARFDNVRFIDPLSVFCDETVCRPFKDDEVLVFDLHHVTTLGADKIYDAFKSDFLWLADKK
jgi:peptidoglycan/LPS O-acetylase OafA/YrhL